MMNVPKSIVCYSFRPLLSFNRHFRRFLALRWREQSTPYVRPGERDAGSIVETVNT